MRNRPSRWEYLYSELLSLQLHIDRLMLEVELEVNKARDENNGTDCDVIDHDNDIDCDVVSQHPRAD